MPEIKPSVQVIFGAICKSGHPQPDYSIILLQQRHVDIPARASAIRRIMNQRCQVLNCGQEVILTNSGEPISIREVPISS